MHLNFDSRTLLLSMLVLIFSLVDYAILRDMMYGILLGSHKKKTADKIVGEQKFFSKFTQKYVGEHITKYEDVYQRWSTVKLVHFIFCVVQLIGFVLLSLFSPWRFWVVCVVLAVITVYDIVLFGLMMRHTATSDYKKSTKGSPWTFEQ